MTVFQQIEAASRAYAETVAALLVDDAHRHAALDLARYSREAALRGTPKNQGPPGTDGEKTTGMVLESTGEGIE